MTILEFLISFLALLIASLLLFESLYGTYEVAVEQNHFNEKSQLIRDCQSIQKIARIFQARDLNNYACTALRKRENPS